MDRDNDPVVRVTVSVPRSTLLRWEAAAAGDVSAFVVAAADDAAALAVDSKARRNRRVARYRAEARKRGDCYVCLRRRAAPGSERCEECANRDKERRTKREDRLWMAGLCPRCGRRPRSATSEKCERCSQLHADYTRGGKARKRATLVWYLAVILAEARRRLTP